MSGEVDVLEQNRELARRFVASFDAGDLATIGELVADDFVWHVAVVPEGETDFRPFQSRELSRRKLPIPAVVQDKKSTLAFFKQLFGLGGSKGEDRFHLRLTNVLADGDQVAFEAEGELHVPSLNRTYRNLYFVLLRVRNEQIVLYKEYQDTLHIYDVFVAE